VSVPVIFDIETGPLPMEQLRKVVSPFEPPKHPGEFDPRTVKYGQAKKDDVRAEILKKAEAKHAEAVASYEADAEKAESEYWAKVEADAALSAITGQVLVIGYRGERVFIDGVGDFGDKVVTEQMLLVRFWNQYRKLRADQRSMIGFNIAGFDVPFIVQRSWILGIPVPETLFTGPQRYLDQTFVDMYKIWKAGNFQGGAKLDEIAKACGVGGKPDGISGADFHRLYANPDTRPLAIEYSANDLDMSWNIAERMGLV
jgi:hypothetical protein